MHRIFRRLFFIVGAVSPMRIAIQADDGDEVSITADFVSVEQAIVTLEIENRIYNSGSEIETVTLTIDRARELAKALLSVVEAIEFVSTPRDLLDRKLHSLSRGIESSIPPFNRRSPN
jgi:hypothetical protein